MYRFYKGEKNNPFNSETDWLSAKFWYYEYVFDSSFFKDDTSDLYSFFKNHDMGKEFMALPSEEDHDNISEKSKKPVFELWHKYLFEYKPYPEYGGENKLEKLLFVLQDAVFIVSNKGLETNIESKGTGVYVYAKRVREITSSTSIEEVVKQYDQIN